MLRLLLTILTTCAVLLATGCRVPRTADLADMTVITDDFPNAGTSESDLMTWFRANGYAAGPNVYQAEAQLQRRPGDPLVYAHQQDKRWWRSQSRSVRDICVTQKIVYYRLTPERTLHHAIQTHRSQCLG